MGKYPMRYLITTLFVPLLLVVVAFALVGCCAPHPALHAPADVTNSVP